MDEQLPQAVIGAIKSDPGDERHWLALADWLWDNGRDDEAGPVRVFWPTLRDNVLISKVFVEKTLQQLKRHAKLLGRRARESEERDNSG